MKTLFFFIAIWLICHSDLVISKKSKKLKNFDEDFGDEFEGKFILESFT